MGMPEVLPKRGADDSFDLVVRPSFGRAYMFKSSVLSSTTSVSEILAAIDASKTDRIVTFFQLAMKFSAQRADQKAKRSAQRAAKLSATIDAVARFREQRSILEVRRIAAQMQVRTSRT